MPAVSAAQAMVQTASCSIETSSRPLSLRAPSRCAHRRAFVCTRVMAQQGSAGSPLDVAIVGGGLGGLITAVAVRRALPDASVKVFERFPAYVKAGALLGLAPNAQAALEAIDPQLHQQVVAAAIPNGISITYDQSGTLLEQKKTGSIVGGGTDGQDRLKEKYGRAVLRIGWWELHQMLQAALPPGLIVFDHRFAGYDESDDSVTVCFTDNQGKEGKEDSVSTSLLVGADGGFSNVRRHVLDDGPPKTPGTVIWRARVPAENVADLLVDDVVERYWVGGRLIGSTWLANKDTREGAWFLGAHKTNLEALGVDFLAEPTARTGHIPVAEVFNWGAGMQVLPIGKTAHERVMKVAASFPERYRRMLAETDPDSVVEHGVWCRDVKQPWGKGRATLVGDAAHPIRPVTGQGFAQAAEDAVTLASCFQQSGLTPAAMRAFEQQRLQRVSYIADSEWELGESSYKAQGRSALEANAAFEKQRNYEDFLFSQTFAPLA